MGRSASIVARCGACQREEHLELPGLDRAAVRAVAALLDGSGYYAAGAPAGGADRIIGRCGRCGGRMECDVVLGPEPAGAQSGVAFVAGVLGQA